MNTDEDEPIPLKIYERPFLKLIMKIGSCCSFFQAFWALRIERGKYTTGSPGHWASPCASVFIRVIRAIRGSSPLPTCLAQAQPRVSPFVKFHVIRGSCKTSPRLARAAISWHDERLSDHRFSKFQLFFKVAQPLTLLSFSSSAMQATRDG